MNPVDWAGTRVRFTASFLTATGQRFAAEAGKTWIVDPCACTLCVAGTHVAVENRRRHLATGNLVAIAAPPIVAHGKMLVEVRALIDTARYVLGQLPYDDTYRVLDALIGAVERLADLEGRR